MGQKEIILSEINQEYLNRLTKRYIVSALALSLMNILGFVVRIFGVLIALVSLLASSHVLEVPFEPSSIFWFGVSVFVFGAILDIAPKSIKKDVIESISQLAEEQKKRSKEIDSLMKSLDALKK